MTEPRRVFEFLEAPQAPPNRACPRCELMVEHARKMSLPTPAVHEVEASATFGMVRYFAGRCRECADWEWSANWNAQYARAAGDSVERQRLEEEREQRVSRGRRFWSDARLEVAPRG